MFAGNCLGDRQLVRLMCNPALRVFKRESQRVAQMFSTLSQGWHRTDSVPRLAGNRLCLEVGTEPAQSRGWLGTGSSRGWHGTGMLSERRVMCAGTRLCHSASCVVPTLAQLSAVHR